MRPVACWPQSSQTGNGLTDARTFDLDYRQTGVAITGGTGLLSQTVGFDANDNAHTITDAVTPANNQTLTYDNLDRLTNAVGAYGTETFTYDSSGNRKTAGSQTNTYAANSNRLTALGSQAVTTNADGNITAIAYPTPLGFTYNKAGRLATATSGGGTVLSYLYDGFGQRLTKTDTAQRFEQYDQNGELLEMTDNLTLRQWLCLRTVRTILILSEAFVDRTAFDQAKLRQCLRMPKTLSIASPDPFSIPLKRGSGGLLEHRLVNS